MKSAVLFRGKLTFSPLAGNRSVHGTATKDLAATSPCDLCHDKCVGAVSLKGKAPAGETGLQGRKGGQTAQLVTFTLVLERLSVRINTLYLQLSCS
jgi:hypothetical protein